MAKPSKVELTIKTTSPTGRAATENKTAMAGQRLRDPQDKPSAGTGKTRQPRTAALGRCVLPAIQSEGDLEQAVAHLLQVDPLVIASLLEAGGMPPLRRREPGFAGLVWILVSQQVSVASANAIFARIKARFDPLEPSAILDCAPDDLATCGLSRPKQRSLHAIAQAVANGTLDFDQLAGMDATTAHATLVSVHGIGPWTADIFLLFCLGHPDAWPAGDLALQEATRMVLKRKTRPDAKQLAKIGARWRPYRGVAARLLWSYYGAVRAPASAGGDAPKTGMALAGAALS